MLNSPSIHICMCTHPTSIFRFVFQISSIFQPALQSRIWKWLVFMHSVSKAMQQHWWSGQLWYRRRFIRKEWKEHGFQPDSHGVFKGDSYYYSLPEDLHAELTKSRAFSLWLLFLSEDRSAQGSVKNIFLKHSWQRTVRDLQGGFKYVTPT